MDYLMQILLDQGWDINEINGAINAAHDYTPSQSQSRAPPSQTQQATAKPAKQSGPPSRPTGVKIICVLGFLGVPLMLVAWVFMYFSIATMMNIDLTPALDIMNRYNLTYNLSAFNEAKESAITQFNIFTIILIIFGIPYLTGLYLLWKMKRIGWIIITVIGIIGMITGLIMTLVYPSIFLGISLIYYALSFIPGVVIICYMFTKRKLFV